MSATGPTAKEFQYELPSDPGVGWPGPPDGAFCSGYFGRLWQTSHLIIENNVIELVIRSLLSDLGRSTGFTTYGFLTAVPPYQIAQFVIRRNTIRNVNNATDPDMRARAIAMWRTENALIEGNIIALDSPKPIEYYDPIVGYTANNFTSAGQPLLVLNALTQQELPDLGSLIEDTSLLASL